MEYSCSAPPIVDSFVRGGLYPFSTDLNDGDMAS